MIGAETQEEASVMKKILALLLAAVLLLSGCAAVAETPESPEITPLDDKYRNYYEVFVYSYADSDGDGIGDFKGLEEKLPYIYDMGFNGIWLMPIMPSPSYHKYDVTDYYDVDPQYGTLEEFRSMLQKAHALGIHVIIDLVVNHSSSDHPWFLDAKTGPEARFRDYYVWSEEPRDGYSPAGGSYYESRFVDSMPDLNLDNAQLRQELEKIMAFWLQDVGVDGFRLDAVTSFYTAKVEKNTEFLDWLGKTAHALKPECYLVGESWTDFLEIGTYSTTAVDSFFLFPVSQSNGYLNKVLANAAATPGETYGKLTLKIEEVLAEHSIPAPFLCNHDTTRAANFLGRSDVEKMKMAAAVLAMLPGNPFVYYGDEIGMIGTGEDPNKRIGMLWTADGKTTQNPPGTTEAGYILPSVEEQQKDEASLLNFYKAAMWLRHANPEIARGVSEVLPCENPDICILRRTWKDSSVTIVVNPSRNDHTVAVEGTLAGALQAAGGEVALENGTLTIPGYSVAILR